MGQRVLVLLYPMLLLPHNGWKLPVIPYSGMAEHLVLAGYMPTCTHSIYREACTCKHTDTHTLRPALVSSRIQNHQHPERTLAPIPIDGAELLFTLLFGPIHSCVSAHQCSVLQPSSCHQRETPPERNTPSPLPPGIRAGVYLVFNPLFCHCVKPGCEPHWYTSETLFNHVWTKRKGNLIYILGWIYLKVIYVKGYRWFTSWFVKDYPSNVHSE